MPICYVKNCNNRSDNNKNNSKLSFHRIPKDSRKDAWIKFCEIENPNLNDGNDFSS